MRDLELPRHGLQILPYEGGAVLTRDGGYLAMYRDHDANRREFARHSKRDAEAYDRYSRDIMRHCRFIRPLLLRTPPDPTSFRPRDLGELALPRPQFCDLTETEILEMVRFWTMSISDLPRRIFREPGHQGLSRGLGHHRHRARPDVAGLGLRAAAPLHGRRRRQRRRLGLRPRRHGRDHPGAWPSRSPRRAAKSAPARASSASWSRTAAPSASCSTAARRSPPRRVVSNMDVKRTFLNCVEEKELPAAVPEAGARPSRPAAPPASSTSRSTACRASRRCPRTRPA